MRCTCTLNLGDLLLPLWQGKFVCDPADTVKNWDWAVLTGNVWKDHSQAIHSGYKAQEWQGYLFGVAPALLHGILPHAYWKNFCKLHSISILQLHVAQQCLDKFHIEFELLYVQCCMDQVPQLGPPCLYSTWTMERTIGNLGEEIKQPSNPFANLSQCGVQHCQINALKLIPGFEDSEDSAVPHGSIDLGGGYILLRAKEQMAHFCNGHAGKLIEDYIQEAEEELGREAEDGWPVKVARWAHVRLPTGQVAWSVWKELQKPLMKLCRARCVKVMINEQVEFAEVQYYFLAKIRGENRGLALISLYSRPDAQLFEDSNWTVYSITALEYNEGLRVVDIKLIQAMVSVQPHSHHVEEGDERFFVGAEEDVLDEI
ncbi:hypothetical protein K439DRAFT_1650085 [Ramaria rubella]|nr:hypothetical protein K439DRAFT_1650085 [Ramaria rubella]